MQPAREDHGNSEAKTLLLPKGGAVHPVDVFGLQEGAGRVHAGLEGGPSWGNMRRRPRGLANGGHRRRGKTAAGVEASSFAPRAARWVGARLKSAWGDPRAEFLTHRHGRQQPGRQ